MIKIKIIRDENNNIITFSVSGHANADEYGKDIVCASISILTQTVILSLYEVANVDVKYEIDDGWLYCQIPKELDNSKRDKANIILDTMLVGIRGTMEMYSEYIELDEEEV